MEIIKIKNLRLRTIIGINDWEREKKQDIIVNIKIAADFKKASQSDDIKDSVDYKTITKRIIVEVEKTNFFLLEKLANFILELIMENKKVISATVEVDKPRALRFADSVSVELTRKNE